MISGIKVAHAPALSAAAKRIYMFGSDYNSQRQSIKIYVALALVWPGGSVRFCPRIEKHLHEEIKVEIIAA